MANLISRVVRGDGMRKTRFHNYDGKAIDLGGFVHLPNCIWTTVWKKATGKRPEVPWLGYRAIDRLSHLIQRDWRVLEFGAGMSTLWFAQRCGSIVSVEDDEHWFRTMQQLLEKRGIRHASLILSSEESYPYPKEVTGRFDLVLVDGKQRDRCMRTALSVVKDQGYIYLDNSDVPYPEFQTAKELLLSAALSKEKIEVFNDLCPTQVSVQQGVLAQVHSSS
jgi:hypothetical protein